MGLKNIDKKFTITTALLAMLLVTTGIGAYETTQVRTLLSNGATPDSSAPAAQAPVSSRSADEPTKKPSEYKFGIPYEKAVKAKKPHDSFILCRLVPFLRRVYADLRTIVQKSQKTI